MSEKKPVRVNGHQRAQSAMKVDVNSYTVMRRPRGKNKAPSSEAVKEKKRQALAKATMQAQSAAQRISQRIATERPNRRFFADGP